MACFVSIVSSPNITQTKCQAKEKTSRYHMETHFSRTSKRRTNHLTMEESKENISAEYSFHHKERDVISILLNKNGLIKVQFYNANK